jgi:zinc and cadmium transporter
MSGSWLLAFYGGSLFVASLLGSWLPRQMAMTHTRTQMVLSTVSGLMLGVAFLHLIPHSFAAAPDEIDKVMAWTLTGLIFMLLMLRLFHFHQHDFGAAADDCAISSGDAHHHAHAHDHAHPPERMLGALGLLFGLCVHTVIDGIALAAVLVTDQLLPMAGIGVFMAILLHKPLDALSIETVMTTGGWSSSARWWSAISFALLCPAAALGFYLGVAPMLSSLWLPAVLAFAAGAFICIALGDLLPEVQFHSHDRIRLTAFFLVGVALAIAIGWLEGTH